MGECLAGGEREGYGVEAVGAAEGDGCCLGRSYAGKLGRGLVSKIYIHVEAVNDGGKGATHSRNIIVESTKVSTKRIRHPQRIARGPLKVHKHRVMITQDISISLQILAPGVLKLGRNQLQRWRPPVPHLVHDLARCGGRGVGAGDGIAASGGCNAPLGELHPGIGHAIVGGEDAGDVVGASVARVCVAEDEDGVSGGVGGDVVGYLAEIGCAGGVVLGFGAGGG